jgi:p-hydroxybenzoate 3-monooxygenase
VLAESLAAWYEKRDDSALRAYSETCLRRVWRTQHFSWWMTSMLHRYPGGDDFQRRLQLSQLEYVCFSEAAARTLAENYVGFDRI